MHLLLTVVIERPWPLDLLRVHTLDHDACKHWPVEPCLPYLPVVVSEVTLYSPRNKDQHDRLRDGTGMQFRLASTRNGIYPKRR